MPIPFYLGIQNLDVTAKSVENTCMIWYNKYICAIDPSSDGANNLGAEIQVRWH